MVDRPQIGATGFYLFLALVFYLAALEVVRQVVRWLGWD